MPAQPTDRDSDPGLDMPGFFQQHFPIVRAKCARVLGDTDEAADVAQETFLRLCQSPVAREPAPARLKWIYVTGTRLAIDHLRSRLRHRRLGVQGTAGADEAPPLPGPGGGLDEALAARQLLARLAGALDPAALEVLILSRCDRLTQDEIGAVLDLSARQVRRLLARADERLAEMAITR